MAKKKSAAAGGDTAAADATLAAERQKARDARFTPEEQRAYVEGCIRKQCGASEAEAAERAAALSPEDFADVHDAGREGRVAWVRELLGCDE